MVAPPPSVVSVDLDAHWNFTIPAQRWPEIANRCHFMAGVARYDERYGNFRVRLACRGYLSWSRSITPPASISIFMEPGMAFGTGTHETTQLCLESLERDFVPGTTCLDVGTGSGILAIAAVKLGARRVVACDIDPIAVTIAAQNGAQNDCGVKIRWIQGDVEQVRRFQPGCIVANLTVELIEQEFWKFEQRLKQGALLIVSGVLNRQAIRVERLRQQSSLRLRRRLKKGEWTCLVYDRP